VFGAPRKRFEAINARFRREAPAIKAALEARLGFQPTIMMRPHDFDTVDALRPVTNEAPAVATSDAAAEAHEEEPIDLDELTEAPDAPAPDPAARLMAGLGAQIVEERSRE
jgi:hypothetical protein